MKKILKYLKNPKLLLLKLDQNGIVRLKDEEYIKLLYESIFGKKLDLDNPQTFNEKLQWLKLHDRNELYKKLVDKYEVKKYVESIIGKEYIIPTINKYEKFDEIKFDELPNQFVLKCTHDSGGIVICKDKKQLDIDNARKKINKSLKNNFYYMFREWAYKEVRPRIIAEEYMGEELNDYKIFCFNGEPKFTLVCSNRVGKHKNTDFFDNNWNHLNFTREHSKNSNTPINKPENFDEMLEIARKLSNKLQFIRVDLYNINGHIYFGELTFYPSGGFEGFYPCEYGKKIGELLELSEDTDEMRKKNEK